MPLRLPADRILATPPRFRGESIGRSRQDRPIYGTRLGHGGLAVSLIGGCHADEPVGPALLERLATFLGELESTDPLIERVRWSLVPHVNPDGAARNAAWSEATLSRLDTDPEVGFDLPAYRRHAVRELPGDDVEFGFPRDRSDSRARPENRAVASFLAAGAPFRVHGSLHGMAFAPGPWFLIEPAWIDRTGGLRERLRQRVGELGYRPLDWDRGGEKGFERIDEGFSTRPDSGAMRRHFESRGDPATAALFRPSSMELVRSLGGDPFTFVSEMPLFLHPDASVLSSGREAFRAWLEEVDADPGREAERISEAGIRPMPIRDQMRLQLALIEEALAAGAE